MKQRSRSSDTKISQEKQKAEVRGRTASLPVKGEFSQKSSNEFSEPPGFYVNFFTCYPNKFK